MKITIGTAMSMLKKCYDPNLQKKENVEMWNDTRETIKKNMPEDQFNALFSVIESNGFISKIFNKDEYVIKLIEDYIDKNIENIIKKSNKIIHYNLR